jgi:hypothetical protein
MYTSNGFNIIVGEFECFEARKVALLQLKFAD